MKPLIVGSPEAMSKEPCLEHPDYFPPQKRKPKDDSQALDDERRRAGFDPDIPYWDGGRNK